MADIMNLNAESGRNIVGDDATPVLELENSSTGSALKVLADPTVNPVFNVVNRSTGQAATVALIKISASVASAPAFEFAGSVVVSTASLSGATLNAAVRVKFGDVYGWLPIYNKIQ